jgi:hypothetical protein
MSRDFNGTTSIILISSNITATTLDNAQPFTACAWVAPDNLGESSSGRIIQKSQAISSGGRWVLDINTNNTVLFVKALGTTNLRVSSVANAIRTDGTFQHVAVTWTGSIGYPSVRLYIDGVETSYANTVNGAGAISSDVNLSLCIGNNPATNRTFDGRIAYAHFFRRVLELDEIRQVMYHPASVRAQGVSAANTSGLVGYWSLGGFSGNEPDFSGNNNVGVITSAPFDPQNPPVNETSVVDSPSQMFHIGG